MKALLNGIKEILSFHVHQTPFRCFDTITREEYKVTIPHHGPSITTWEAETYIRKHTDFDPVKVVGY